MSTVKSETILSWAAGILLFATGLARGEPILTLVGLGSLGVLGYFLLALGLWRLLHRDLCLQLSCTIVPENIRCGETTTIVVQQSEEHRPLRLFPVPGIFPYYKVDLTTRDGKSISVQLKIPRPSERNSQEITSDQWSRGVYYGDHDCLLLSDALGFYHLCIPLQSREGERLYIRPLPAAFFQPPSIHGGGDTRRTEHRYRRTEDLTDNRPYVPGDDPRRINWKLYSHAGSLFIRQGELEPPPNTELIFIIDTSIDHRVFSASEGRALVDLLTAQTLRFGLDLLEARYALSLAYPGSQLRPLTADELSQCLSFPAAIDAQEAPSFPVLPTHSSIFIFALPRLTQGPELILDRLLAKRHGGAREKTKLFFLDPSSMVDRSGISFIYESCRAAYAPYSS
ncbi:MAG: DUF58 domain-containing protein [Termitinemataceae bacterium]